MAIGDRVKASGAYCNSHNVSFKRTVGRQLGLAVTIFFARGKSARGFGQRLIPLGFAHNDAAWVHAGNQKRQYRFNQALVIGRIQ
ncbi:hypothetical protein SDC9_208228 [bioreactor metagenome]|uniref:Uncharacterized protein n=1 Tax=bioreactor metagenome TaxID=1076179 RepID=A0A645JBP6_9ZZZZ